MQSHKSNYGSKVTFPRREFRGRLGIGETTDWKWTSAGVLPKPMSFGRYKRVNTEGEWEIIADIKLAARDFPDDFDIKAEDIVAEVNRQLGAVPPWVLILVARTKNEIGDPFDVDGNARNTASVAA